MSAMDATRHDELRQLAGAYVLDALEPAERAEFAAHLATCTECTAEVRALRGIVSALPYTVPQIDPPFALRQRVLASVGAAGTDRATRGGAFEAASALPRRGAFASRGWLSLAALLVIAVSLGTYAMSLRQRLTVIEQQLQNAIVRLDRTERQLDAASREAQAAQVRLAVLTASDLLQVNLAGQAPAPGASGRAFWSRSRGLLFAASQLPPLPGGRTYQLWFLQSPGTTPVSAGLVKPDEAGRVALGFDSPPNLPQPTGFALSIEPEGGVPAPTGALYLAGMTQ
jgi:anti-sigma-K factor RskA